MTMNKDSPEVVKFMLLFQKLKDWSDDDPESLPELASKDESIKDLCLDLLGAAGNLQRNERGDRELFTAPVDSKFITTWRDFEDRFERVLDDLFWHPLIKRESEWEHADLNAAIAADLIEKTIEFACFRAAGDESELSLDYTLTTEEVVRYATADWEGLKDEIGFDLHGVFRRRRLIPFVLIPRHVAARHDQSKSLSVYQNLRQAHEAFVFGAPFAALALMRSIMEVVLRDHYGADGNDLSERISSSRKLLPKGANEAALHRLRKTANAILHLDTKKDEPLPKLEPIQMEMEILSLLRVLRALIEGAPQWRSR
jgi:hypothetical protein